MNPLALSVNTNDLTCLTFNQDAAIAYYGLSGREGPLFLTNTSSNLTIYEQKQYICLFYEALLMKRTNRGQPEKRSECHH